MGDKETIVDKLNRMLKTLHVVRFTYIKKNGEIRHARGTKRIDVVEEIDEGLVPKNDMSYTDTVIRYFDLDKENWRTVCKDNIVSIESSEPNNMFD